MSKIGLLAYGETGNSALTSLLREFEVAWVVVPELGDNKLPVEDLAKEKNIQIVHTNSNQKITELVRSSAVDCVVISSYNKILPKELLEQTRFINVHHGDLPRWRGRANINWAIINGRKDIGLTFHEAAPNLDAGNIYEQYMIPIEDNDTVKTIYDKFNAIIEEKTADIVKKVLEGETGVSQTGDATYCCTRLPEDGLIDWTKTTKEIYNLIRALTKPYPGAFTFFKGEKMVVWESEIPEDPKTYEGRIPGRIIEIHTGKGVEVLTGDSSIIIKLVTYGNEGATADTFIKSIKNSLGLTILDIYNLLKNKNEY